MKVWPLCIAVRRIGAVCGRIEFFKESMDNCDN